MFSQFELFKQINYRVDQSCKMQEGGKNGFIFYIMMKGLFQLMDNYSKFTAKQQYQVHTHVFDESAFGEDVNSDLLSVYSHLSKTVYNRNIKQHPKFIPLQQHLDIEFMITDNYHLVSEYYIKMYMNMVLALFKIIKRFPELSDIMTDADFSNTLEYKLFQYVAGLGYIETEEQERKRRSLNDEQVITKLLELISKAVGIDCDIKVIPIDVPKGKPPEECIAELMSSRIQQSQQEQQLDHVDEILTIRRPLNTTIH